MSHPYKAHSEQAHGKARAKELTQGYKRGGAVKGGKTTININVGKPDLPTGGMRPLLAPPVPPGPPMGGPPLPPGGAGPFARGGRAEGGRLPTPQQLADENRARQTNTGQTPEQALANIKKNMQIPKKASGGAVKMTAGAETGEGRLQKAKIQKRK